MTIQTFGHAAIVRALNEAALGKKADGEVEREPERDEPPVQSLGIRDRLTQDESERERDDYRREEPIPVAAPTPMLASHSIDNEILALARTVVESPQSSKRDVLKAACRALSRGRTQEESVRLAEDLDAAIQRLSGVPQTALERVRARMGR